MDKPSVHKIYEFEGFRFDAEHLMLYGRGESIPLAPKAAETLLVFIEHRGQILSKEELIEQIWPNAFVEESNLFLYLSVLRKALGNQEDGTPYLETLRRRGYRFNCTVQLISEGSWGELHSAPVQVIEPIDSFRSATADSLSVNDLSTDPSVWRPTNPVNDLSESLRGWSLRRSSFAAIGVIALMALVFGYKYFFSPRSIHSIAVMPFVNDLHHAVAVLPMNPRKSPY
jgi:DNA-binding winged helix-turn-helix (wHTH) protein